MPAGVDDSDNHRTVRLLKATDSQVALGRDQCPVAIVGLHGKTPRIEGDSIRRGKAAREESFPTLAETGGKIVLGELHILADLLQRDNRLAGHLWRRIDFFRSSIVSVATWPCS
ncbi:MAG: hypothetical protein HYX71_07905 [Opitutae bacterium]|nr:hypothetical protein [Opitutae bacterium]